MSGRKYDMAIVGGGLAGGLIALALHQQRPKLDLVLIEAGATLGGNRRWNWFASDLSAQAGQMLEPFRKTDWKEGYELRFPAWRRQIGTVFHSLSSHEFDAGLRRMLPGGTIRNQAEAVQLDAAGVTLADGERIDARAVIDCRGFAPSSHLAGGWLVSFARHLRTAAPHRMQHPLAMDARIDQQGGFRFVRVLPLGARELLVEDCGFSESPDPDRRALSSRVEAYCTLHGWQGDILGWEAGVLPVITGGDFAAFQAERRLDGVAVAGARGGLIHPLTSSILPQAVECALAIAAEADLPGQQLAALLEDRARRHWRSTGFYRKLGPRLGARPGPGPGQGQRLFEQLYRMPRGTIERFHAAHSTALDRARFLFAKARTPTPAQAADR